MSSGHRRRRTVATQDLSKSLTSIRQDMKRHRLQLLNLEAEREKEQREQDEEAFASADANGDGQLSKAEASSFATLLRKKPSDDRIADLERELDASSSLEHEPTRQADTDGLMDDDIDSMGEMI